MAASLTDKFRKTVAFFATSLTSSISATDTSFTFDSATDVPTDTAVDMVFDRVDSDGNKLDSSLREVATGTVSGSTFTTALGNRGLDGTVTQSHSAGAVVEGNMTAAMWNDMVDGVLVSHNQDGTQATNSVPTAAIQDGAVTRSKIASEAWQTYTPTPTQTSGSFSLGNGTLTGAYCKTGRTVSFRVNLTMGSTTTYGSGDFNFPLPVSSASGYGSGTAIGQVYVEHSGSAGYMGVVRIVSTTTVKLSVPNQASTGIVQTVSQSTPFTFGVNDFILFSGTYEAAS